MKLLFIVPAIVAAMIATTANAADFDAKITNVDGSALVDDKGKPVELTVRTVALNALLAPYPDEQNLPGDIKMKRYNLAKKISEGKVDDLASEDVAMIKQLVNKYYQSPVTVTQAWEALERKGK